MRDTLHEGALAWQPRKGLRGDANSSRKEIRSITIDRQGIWIGVRWGMSFTSFKQGQAFFVGGDECRIVDVHRTFSFRPAYRPLMDWPGTGRTPGSAFLLNAVGVPEEATGRPLFTVQHPDSSGKVTTSVITDRDEDELTRYSDTFAGLLGAEVFGGS